MKLYPAKISTRAWALFIDSIVLAVVSTTYSVFLTLLVPFDSDVLTAIVSTLCALSVLFYIPIMEIFYNGQTLGKRGMGIKVVNSDGSPASASQCLQRYLMLISFDLPTVIGGVTCASISPRAQRVGDILADTMVVMRQPQKATYPDLRNEYDTLYSEEEKEVYQRVIRPQGVPDENLPLALAHRHRQIECILSQQRTLKAHPSLIEFLESELSFTHLSLFRHKSYSWQDFLEATIKSIPRAIYESRWWIFASMVICVLSYVIGVAAQYTAPDFFRSYLGDYYTRMTIHNIENGNPMGVYSQMSEREMFKEIFFNNLLVTLRIYCYGVIPIIGTLFSLLSNFVMIGCFQAFFAQHGLLLDGLMVPSMHGTLELWSIVVTGAASLRLGTGWLFPGKFTRTKAFTRSARQSILLLISALPMVLVAAFIESVITRHTEWPIGIRLSIIILSSIFIIGYYAVLPFLSKTR